MQQGGFNPDSGTGGQATGGGGVRRLDAKRQRAGRGDVYLDSRYFIARTYRRRTKYLLAIGVNGKSELRKGIGARRESSPSDKGIEARRQIPGRNHADPGGETVSDGGSPDGEGLVVQTLIH